MPNVNRDDKETFEQVIRPMMNKIAKVCKAFEIPFVMMFQPATTEEAGEVTGELFMPTHASMHLEAATYVLQAKDSDDLERRVMKMAAYFAMRELKSKMRDGSVSALRDLFAGMEQDSDKVDKPLN